MHKTLAHAVLDYVAHSGPVLMLTLDTQLCVQDANALAKRVLTQHAVGRSMGELVVNLSGHIDLHALAAQEGVTHMLTLNTATGLPETFYFRFFPLPSGTLALGSLDFAEQERLRDEMLALNSDLNKLTRQVQAANSELRELNELKSKFLGMAVHDLRNPLGLIMNYSGFVLDEAGPSLSADHQDFLRTSIDAAAGMQSLIEDFLDVSVIESGKLRLSLVPANASEILASVAQVGGLLARKKQVSLLVQKPESGPRIDMDIQKMQQVLINLIGNAVEHSLAGQRVWLTANHLSNDLVFSVRDEGPGIADGEQKNLFTAFVRGSARKTGGERSTGLGLAIAHQIVKAHGGRIWVESVLGEGATFFFSLPFNADYLPQTTP